MYVPSQIVKLKSAILLHPFWPLISRGRFLPLPVCREYHPSLSTNPRFGCNFMLGGESHEISAGPAQRAPRHIEFPSEAAAC